MTNTELTYLQWKGAKDNLSLFEKELADLEKQFDSFKNENIETISAEHADRLLKLQNAITSKRLHGEQMEKSKIDAESILKNTLKTLNVKSIRIPSNRINVMDTEIFVNEDGELTSRGIM